MLAGVRRSGGPPVLLWPAGLVVWGPGATSSLHAHHAVQLILTLDGHGRLRGRARQRWTDFTAALIGPDVPHEVDARGTTVVIAFVDPQSEVGGGLLGRLKAPVSVLPAAEVERWRRELGAPSLGPAAVETWWRARIAVSRAHPRIHPRVSRVLRWLRSNVDASAEDCSLEALAERAGLSPSRFMHAFTQSLGVPVRPYLLWLRLQHAAGRLLSGATATEAAHEAGFADAAHLSRTFRRTLGTTPREIAASRAQGQIEQLDWESG
jgi:AraC-like DNA-binding protein